LLGEEQSGEALRLAREAERLELMRGGRVREEVVDTSQLRVVDIDENCTEAKTC